jgi:hypothetical protein
MRQLPSHQARKSPAARRRRLQPSRRAARWRAERHTETDMGRCRAWAAAENAVVQVRSARRGQAPRGEGKRRAASCDPATGLPFGAYACAPASGGRKRCHPMLNVSTSCWAAKARPARSPPTTNTSARPRSGWRLATVRLGACRSRSHTTLPDRLMTASSIIAGPYLAAVAIARHALAHMRVARAGVLASSERRPHAGPQPPSAPRVPRRRSRAARTMDLFGGIAEVRHG